MNYLDEYFHIYLLYNYDQYIQNHDYLKDDSILVVKTSCVIFYPHTNRDLTTDNV